ncbi:MAG: molybdopterin-binding protein [Candidatus Hodarchaeota archaeon]
MEKALLISIGNELLSGKTINTNATFLAKKLTKLGFLIHKILTIPDDQKIVSEEISRALSDVNYRLILITGGLGPTWDDSTSSFLAKALNTELELNSEALSIVTRRYADLFKEKLVDTAEITPSREKMAFLPINAKPIDNPVGTAPGIFYNHKTSNTWVICFPGVPREMEEMYHLVEPKIISLINEKKTNYHEIEFYTPFTDESLLAPLLDKVRKKHDVWIKSLPETYQEEKKIHIIISKASNSVNAKEEVLAAKLYLQKIMNSSYSGK